MIATEYDKLKSESAMKLSVFKRRNHDIPVFLVLAKPARVPVEVSDTAVLLRSKTTFNLASTAVTGS